MKKISTSLLLLLISIVIYAQNLPDFDKIPLTTKDDFNEQADQAALDASNFLLTTVYAKDNLPRLKATQYVLKWMSGTPHYKFTIDESATKISKKDEGILGLYLAAQTKYTLENKEQAKDSNAVKLNTFKLIIAYCEHPDNKIKITGELKKLIEAQKAGKLEEYLNL